MENKKINFTASDIRMQKLIQEIKQLLLEIKSDLGKSSTYMKEERICKHIPIEHPVLYE